jgi:small subunit ribosomal protein S16
MLSIRLSRVGKKNRAQFRIVIQEHTAAPTGKNIEFLGSYNPHTKEAIFKEERIKYWMSQGAQLSDTVHNLLVSNKIIDSPKKSIKIRIKKKKDKESENEKKTKEKKQENAEKPVEEKIEKTKEGDTKEKQSVEDSSKEGGPTLAEKEEKKETASSEKSKEAK